jgi:hypothetical protein
LESECRWRGDVENGDLATGTSLSRVYTDGLSPVL